MLLCAPLHRMCLHATITNAITIFHSFHPYFSLSERLSLCPMLSRLIHRFTSPFISYSIALRLRRSFQWWSEYFYLISSKNSSQKMQQTIAMHAPHSNAIFISKNNVLDIIFRMYHPTAAAALQHMHTHKMNIKRILWIFDLFNCNISQDRSFFCTFHEITVQNIKMCRFDLT